MFWNNDNRSKDEDTSASADNDRPLSNQSKMISTALRQADRAMKQANYMFSQEGTTSKDIMNDQHFMDTGSSDDGSSTYVGTITENNTIKTGAGSKSTGASLNLKHNDSQFHVIAGLVVSKFEHFLTSGANSFALSFDDKQQLDRIVSRDNFVDAVRHRIQTCPEKPVKPIHLLTRHCKALGLHRYGDQNLLFAPAGTIIDIEKLPSPEPDDETTLYTKDSATTGTKSHYSKLSNTNLDRDHILAELREATNLMTESVTPEAAQFWRNHCIELENRLQSTQHRTEASSSGTHSMVGCDEQILSTLHQFTTSVPRKQNAIPQTYHSKHNPMSKKKRNELATSTLDPELQGITMIDVVAPANLPEGYTFEAEIDECRFVATVPAGGVRKGETFACYARDMEKLSDTDVPMSNWRDRLFDCLTHGVAHPVCLNSFFCPLLALSQIMTRMGLDFMGLHGQSIPRRGLWSTRGMTLTILLSWVFLNSLIAIGFYIKKVDGVAISGADIAAFAIVNVGMFLYTVYAASNTRAIIREKYKIRQGYCGDWEDSLLSSVCMPCSIAQMGRHTVAYDEHKALCCSDTGLEEGVDADITAHTHVGSYRIW